MFERQIVAYHNILCVRFPFSPSLQTLGPKAVGVAFSPLDNYVAVGLAAQRLIVHPSAAQVRKRFRSIRFQTHRLRDGELLG